MWILIQTDINIRITKWIAIGRFFSIIFGTRAYLSRVFTECVGVPHLNRDAHFKCAGTHIILWFYQPTHSDMQNDSMWNFPFATNLKHVFARLRAHNHINGQQIQLHFLFQILFVHQLRILIANVPRNSCGWFWTAWNGQDGGRLGANSCNSKEHKNKQIKQVDNIYCNCIYAHHSSWAYADTRRGKIFSTANFTVMRQKNVMHHKIPAVTKTLPLPPCK